MRWLLLASLLLSFSLNAKTADFPAKQATQMETEWKGLKSVLAAADASGLNHATLTVQANYSDIYEKRLVAMSYFVRVYGFNGKTDKLDVSWTWKVK